MDEEMQEIISSFEELSKQLEKKEDWASQNHVERLKALVMPMLELVEFEQKMQRLAHA